MTFKKNISLFHLLVNASLYKTYKNKVNHTLRLAKRLYYEEKLQDVKSNTRATWKILNGKSQNLK